MPKSTAVGPSFEIGRCFYPRSEIGGRLPDCCTNVMNHQKHIQRLALQGFMTRGSEIIPPDWKQVTLNLYKVACIYPISFFKYKRQRSPEFEYTGVITVDADERFGLQKRRSPRTHGKNDDWWNVLIRYLKERFWYWRALTLGIWEFTKSWDFRSCLSQWILGLCARGKTILKRHV